MTMTNIPTMCVDFASREVNRDPIPHVTAVREAGPAVYNPAIDRWMIGGFDDVRKVLADETNFAPDRDFFLLLFGGMVAEAEDNPRHNEIRGIWNSHFQRDSVAKLRPVIEQIIDNLLGPFVDQLRVGKTLDAVSSLTLDVSTHLICRLLGVPGDDIAEWGRWGGDLNGLVMGLFEGDTPRGEKLRSAGFAASASMCTYAGRALAERRGSGKSDDLIGIMAASPVANTMVEPDQRASIAQLFMGGHETTSKLVGQFLILLDQHPEQRAAIVSDHSLIPRAIEEAIRFGGSLGAILRSARVDVEVGGVPIPKGSLVFTLPIAANRDPSRWENPDTFDIFRPVKQHIGFGFGTHSCIGQNLSRLTAQILLGRILDTIPDYRVAEEEIDYGTNWLVRGPTRLRLAV